MSDYVVLTERINQLRSIDKLVDISKSTIQIDIMLSLMKGGKSSAEIAREIGQRRKAVTDAMRKLRLKGLVDEVFDETNGRTSRYMLTTSGLNCLTTLLELTGSERRLHDEDLDENEYPKKASLDTGALLMDVDIHANRTAFAAGQSNDVSSFLMTSVLSEMILLLGTSRGYVKSRKNIAQAIGLGEQRTESYLDVYLAGTPKLFRKYTEVPRSARILSKFGIKSRKTNTIYGLTNEGLQYFYRLPSYAKLKQSVVYKLLSKMTGTSHPKSVFKRLTMMLCGAGAVSVLSLLMPWGYLASGMLLFATAFVGAIILLDGLLYNSM